MKSSYYPKYIKIPVWEVYFPHFSDMEDAMAFLDEGQVGVFERSPYIFEEGKLRRIDSNSQEFKKIIKSVEETK